MLRNRLLLLSIVVLLVLVSGPYLVAPALTPADREFLGAFHDPFDTPVYLSALRAGARGDWLRTLPFTTEPHASAIYYPFYLLLGHLAPPTIITFHVARLLIAIWLCLATWVLIGECMRDETERRTAFVLAIFGMGVGWLVLISGLWRIVRPTDLFAPTSTLFGASFINPHFPLTATLEFVTLTAYLRARRQPRPKRTLIVGALACFAMGWVVPYSLVVAALVMGCDALIAMTRQRRLWTTATRATFVILLPSAATIAYDLALVRFDPFWSALVAQWSPLDHTFTPIEYVAGYGFELVFALAGAIYLLRQRERGASEQLLLVWFVVNAALIASPLDFSDRTSLGFSAPLAMLSAVALVRFVKAKAPRFIVALPRLMFLVVLPAPLLLMLSHALTVQQYDDVPYFLPRDDVAAAEWLRQHTRASDIVLAAPTLANQIPALTDARVYSGHTHETFDPKRKNAEIATFFDAATSDAARIAFLKQQGITFVYAKPNVRRMGAFDGASADYLTPVFRSGSVTIYRVTLNDQ